MQKMEMQTSYLVWLFADRCTRYFELYGRRAWTDMEREPICYIYEGKEEIRSAKDFLCFVRKQPECRTVFFFEQAIVKVCIPVWNMPEKKKGIGKIAGFINHYYTRKVQNKLWDVLLQVENTSVQPAFCSEGIYQRFRGEALLKHELWLTTQLPGEIIQIALYLFLKKECTFRKETKVFIIDEGSIELENALYPYCNKLNFLQFLVEKKDCHEEFVREIYEESGLAIAITTKKENAEGADIILDLGRVKRLKPEHLKKGCIYFDGFSDRDMERKIRMRGDILYFSAYHYLKKYLTQ